MDDSPSAALNTLFPCEDDVADDMCVVGIPHVCSD